MLNPSTANHEFNDPTIERCERRAKSLGFGSLIVWNLFAFRTSDPKHLKTASDPIGPENDAFISEALHEVKSKNGTVVVGWGMHGELRERAMTIINVARSFEILLYCLGKTQSGQPRHPLYVPYGQELLCWS
jgi:hypothetical protein